MEMRSDTRIVAAADLLAAPVGDELVLLDLHRGVYYGLNAPGARIWELLVEGLPFAEVATRLAAEHDVSPAQVEIDIVRLVDELREKALIASPPS
ncbi:MAG: hypothetical protein QOC81_3015 [Thermoanaerobaculia bacterium]|jgi:hypothetical protein|nr:hypothetical protein [Thermoanaerobaculia bacterium]